MARTYYYFDCETSGLIRSLASPESRKALVLGGKKLRINVNLFQRKKQKVDCTVQKQYKKPTDKISVHEYSKT